MLPCELSVREVLFLKAIETVAKKWVSLGYPPELKEDLIAEDTTYLDPAYTDPEASFVVLEGVV